MELRYLKHFLAVAENGGVSAAARALGITQPALSRRMKALEEEFGTALFERGAGPLVLTDAGEILRAEAGKLVSFADALPGKIRSAAMGEPIRVGYAPSLAASFLPVAISRFTQRHPRASVNLLDVSSAEMRERLARGKLDLIITVPCEENDAAISWTPLVEYGWHLVLPADHELAVSSDPLPPAALSGLRLLLYEKESYPDYWSLITGYFRRHAIQAKIAGEFDGVTSLIAALEGNLGVALLGDITALPATGKLARIPLAEPPDPIRVAAGIPHGAENKRALAFIEELKYAAT